MVKNSTMTLRWLHRLIPYLFSFSKILSKCNLPRQHHRLSFIFRRTAHLGCNSWIPSCAPWSLTRQDLWDSKSVPLPTGGMDALHRCEDPPLPLNPCGFYSGTSLPKARIPYRRNPSSTFLYRRLGPEASFVIFSIPFRNCSCTDTQDPQATREQREGNAGKWKGDFPRK